MYSVKSINKNNPKNSILFISTVILMLNVLTLNTFISSIYLEIISLSVTLLFLISYYVLSNNSIVVNRVEVMWYVFTLYFIINIIIQNFFLKLHILDIFIFIFFILFLTLYKVNINYYTTSFKIILFVSIVYALSAIFQYLNMDLYSKLILPRFNSNEIETILRLFRGGNYTGFTNQTAFLAGFLVYGIGIVFILYRNVKQKYYKIIFLISLPLLFYSLLLTGKRAHLLFMVASLIFTYLFSTELNKVSNYIIKYFIGVGATLLIIGIIISRYTPTAGSQFAKVYIRLQNTIQGFLSGEDVTSGRIYLYESSLKHFAESPIFGIGWRKFREISIGIINTDFGSHPHNIYLQLLTELGIIGFVLFMIPLIYVFIRTIILLRNASFYFNFDIRWKVVLQYSLYVQFFFLFYGITGNLLTDHIFLIMYFFAVSIVLSSMKYVKANQNIDKKIIEKH